MIRRPPRTATALVTGAVAVAVLGTGCSTGPDPAPGPPIGTRVVVEQGELAGAADGDVLRFRGVPYAAPPTGELRWRAAQPAAGWDGVRPATGTAPRCPQRAAVAGAPHATAASSTEDCLTLDVTVPMTATAPTDGRTDGPTDGSAGLPVLVWLHGGGFNAGAATDYDPRRLALAGPMIVVTVNYRLGALGFLGLPGLADSGSFGLLDQQQALRWVQRNAVAFGGDPGNVTLAGESAGADSVCAQLAAPAAEGLFRRAIMQSGGCSPENLTEVIRPGAGEQGDTWKPLPLVEEMGTDAAADLGCPDPGTAVGCLRALPVDALAPVAGTYWSPAAGTPTVPRRPSDLVADGQLRRLPVLAGTTAQEGTLFTDLFHDRVQGPLTEERVARLLGSIRPDPEGPDATRVYPLTGRSPGRAWAEVITDRGYACPALTAFDALGPRAPLFAYEFAEPAAPSPFDALPADLAGGSTHGAEVPFLLDLVPGQPALTGPQQQLAEQLLRAWAGFARTGDPNDGRPDDQPEWPRWTGDGELRVFGSDPQQSPTRTAPAHGAAHHCALYD